MPDNHNTKIAIDKLIDLRIMRKTTDDMGSDVYILVDMLKMHLRYEEDAEVEESIGKDLKRLYRDGNAIINARKRKRNDNDTIVQNSEREEEEEDEENENNDKDVQTSEREEKRGGRAVRICRLVNTVSFSKVWLFLHKFISNDRPNTC